MTILTAEIEAKIERNAERQMDRLDRQLMSGTLDQQQYDAAVKALDADTANTYRRYR